MADELLMVFYDVQHGSAAYLKTPNQKHIMIDLGTGSIKDSNQTFSPLLRLKDYWGVQQLDQVIITHPHRDHIDDIDNFDALNPRVLLRPKHLTEQEIRGGNKQNPGEQSKINKYLEISASYSAPVGPAESVTASNNNGGVTIQTFQPVGCDRSNLNDQSIVTVVSYANSKIIVPGDNEETSWQELLGEQAFLDAIEGTDILVASHHGRESGYCADLFQHIKPSLVIISDGPAGGTSVTGKYYNATTTKGWTVYSRSDGSSQQRWVLTTRDNKAIVVKFGSNTQSNGSYRNVTVDRF
jgi:beta-lactamase superfamily II metal-dependent hydrolase